MERAWDAGLWGLETSDPAPAAGELGSGVVDEDELDEVELAVPV